MDQRSQGAQPRQAERHRHLRLGLVRQPEQREPSLALHQGPRRLESGLPRRGEGADHRNARRARAHAQRGPRHHAEPALAPQDQLAEIGAGRAGGTGRKVETPSWSDQREARHQIVDRAIAERLLPRGAGDDPPAHARQLPRLREVPQREPARGERALERGAERAGPHGGEARHGIERLETGKARQVETHRRPVSRGDVHPAGDRRAAAPGNDDDARARAGVQHRLRFGVAGRADDRVRYAADRARSHADEVGEPLAARVQQAIAARRGDGGAERRE